MQDDAVITRTRTKAAPELVVIKLLVPTDLREMCEAQRDAALTSLVAPVVAEGLFALGMCSFLWSARAKAPQMWP